MSLWKVILLNKRSIWEIGGTFSRGDGAEESSLGGAEVQVKSPAWHHLLPQSYRASVHL